MAEVYKKFIYEWLAEINDAETLKKVYTVLYVFRKR